MAAEKHEFTTAVRDLLHLMVHSLYSNKEIFLRELISNASDALDKLRVESLTKPELAPKGDLHIRLEVDEKARTLTLHDNGIGMSREDVVRDIGTIARSGTKQYLAALKERAKSDDVEAQLIGQFGVGFYSTFMVADEVTLVTRKAGEPGATRWQSTGDGSYTIEETTRDEAGTTVTLKQKLPIPTTGSPISPRAMYCKTWCASTPTSSTTPFAWWSSVASRRATSGARCSRTSSPRWCARTRPSTP